MENILVAGANGTTGKKVVHLLMESPDFNLWSEKKRNRPTLKIKILKLF
jgi:dihydrodipicolinate reductase